MKHKQLTNEEIAALCRALSWLLHAGMEAGDALTLMAQDARGQEAELLTQMAQLADEGLPPAEVFRRTNRFPHYVCALLEAGERTGRTEEAFRALTDYYEARARLERQARSTLLYPAVLLLLMLTVVVVLLCWVLPVFSEVYAQLGTRLVGLAGGLLALGSFLRRLLPLLCVPAGAVLILAAILLLAPGFRTRLLGRLQRRRSDRGSRSQMRTAVFAQTLAMGLNSGLDGIGAAELALQLTEEGRFRKRCEACLQKLRSGASLPDALGNTELFSRADCRLLEAGIRSGRGENAMAQAADRLMEEYMLSQENRLAKTEPTLVVISSLLVGLILLSVMLPLLHVMGAMG